MTDAQTTPPRKRRVRKRRDRAERGKRRTGSLTPKEELSRQSILCMSAMGTCMILGPELFAGTFGWSMVVIGLLSILCLSTTWGAWKDRPAHMCDVAVLAAWSLTVFQALPLPTAMAEWLSPLAVANSHEVISLLGGETPGWSFWSHDPGSTAIEALKGSGIVCLYLSARSGLVSSTSIAKLLVASVATLSLVTLAHLAGIFDGIFGVYTPTFTPELPSPVLTSNHAGGFYALGCAVAVGLALSKSERKRLALWICAASVFAILCVASLSRGAVAAMLLGVGLLALRLRMRGRDRRLPLALAAMTMGSLVAALYVGSHTLIRGLSDHSAEKVSAAMGALPIAWEHPWLGVGRGSFAAVFASMHGGGPRYVYPENILVQWLTEWGVPLTVFLLWILGLTLVRVLLRKGASTSTLAIGCGLIALTAQNVVDFSFEMMGLSVVFAALLGSVVDQKSESVSQIKLKWLVPSVLLVALFVSVATLTQAWQGTAEERVAALIEVFKEGNKKEQQGLVEQTQASLVDSLRRHPAEPAFSLVAGARAASRSDEKDALKWLGRSMLLAPQWAAPHVTTAEVLHNMGRHSQAALEVHEAETRQLGSTRSITCRLLQTYSPNIDSLMAAVDKMAPKANRVEFLDMSAGCKLPAAFKAQVDQRIIDEGGKLRAPLIRSAARALANDDPTEALNILASLDPEDWDVLRWQARATANLKDAASGIAILEKNMKSRQAPDSVLSTLAKLQAESGRVEDMKKTLARLRGRSGGKKKPFAQAKKLEGDLLAQTGDSSGAMDAYKEALTFDPKSESLEASYHLSEAEERHLDAERIRETLCSVRGGGWCPSKEKAGATQNPQIQLK